MESFTERAVALGTSGQERISLGMSIFRKLCHTVVVGCFLVATTPHAHAQSRPSLVAGSALPQVIATEQVSGTKQLLIAAGALWFSNTIVFALWYWRLDAGGPNGRDARLNHDAGLNAPEDEWL